MHTFLNTNQTLKNHNSTSLTKSSERRWKKSNLFATIAAITRIDKKKRSINYRGRIPFAVCSGEHLLSWFQQRCIATGINWNGLTIIRLGFLLNQIELVCACQFQCIYFLLFSHTHSFSTLYLILTHIYLDDIRLAHPTIFVYFISCFLIVVEVWFHTK